MNEMYLFIEPHKKTDAYAWLKNLKSVQNIPKKLIHNLKNIPNNCF